MKKKTTRAPVNLVNNVKGWTYLNSIAAQCDFCNRYFSLGSDMYWRWKTDKKGKTEIGCADCVDKM